MRSHNLKTLHLCTIIILQELSKEGSSEAKEPHVLLIFDSLIDLPSPSSFLHTLIHRNSTHIIFIIEENHFSAENLKGQVEKSLLRGTNVAQLHPLSGLHVTQRLVHSIMTKCDFAPYNREQDILAIVAERSLGSSDLVDVVSSSLLRYIDEDKEKNTDGFLARFHSEVCYFGFGEEVNTVMEEKGIAERDTKESERYINEHKEGDRETKPKEGEKIKDDKGEQPSNSDFITQLINSFHLSKEDFVMLSVLSLFGRAPLPLSLVQQIQTIIQEVSTEPQKTQSPMETLMSACLLNRFPSPVISQALCPPHSMHPSASSLFYMPLMISTAVRKSMDTKDILISLSTAHLGLCAESAHTGNQSHVAFLAGLTQILLDVAEEYDEVIYTTIYKTYLSFIGQFCKI